MCNQNLSAGFRKNWMEMEPQPLPIPSLWVSALSGLGRLGSSVREPMRVGKTERLERWRYRYIFLLRCPILGSLTDEIRDDDKDMTSQQANINIMNKPCVERAEIQRFLKHYICMGGPYSMGFLLC